MNVVELLRLAFSSLLTNRLRSLLTVLGIVIGVAAVVTLVSFGQSYQSYVDSQFQGIGSTMLNISSTNPTGRNANLVKARPLTLADVAAIANPQNVAGVAAVAPSYNVNATLVANSNSMSQSVTGTTDAYAIVRSQTVSAGRFITPNDVNSSAMVAVIGTAIVQTLYTDGSDPIGQQLRINGLSFTVIGVLTSKSGGAGNQDKVVIAPITTVQSRLDGADARTSTGEYRVSNITVETASASLNTQVTADITALLSDRHQIQYVGEEDFRIFSQGAIVDSLNSILSLLTLFLGMIAGISLLVGGIGVMNIMLVTVTERTREIGLRKAVGATYSDLLWQFLIESVTLCVTGGLLGVALGVGLSLIGNTLLPTFTINVSVPAIFLAVGVSSAIGVFFGLYPASRAAVLKPIEALRYE